MFDSMIFIRTVIYFCQLKKFKHFFVLGRGPGRVCVHIWTISTSLSIYNLANTWSMLAPWLITFDFRTSHPQMEPVVLNDGVIETVQEHKYLGTIIDSKLDWTSHTKATFSEYQTRMFFLRDN